MTCRFAPVVPIEVAAAMGKVDILGNYHLLLAHDVVANSKAYHDVYSKITYPTIIMDNSVIELGSPVGPGTMIAALEAVYVDGGMYIVVLPDQLLDYKGTIESTTEALNGIWGRDIKENFPQAHFMAVPQGKDIGEWVKCLEALSFHDEITWLGIPRNFREKLGGSRIQAIQIAHMIKAGWQLHLLGFSDDLHDDMVSCHLSNKFDYPIHGIDSAVPIRMAMRDHQELRFSNQDHSPRGDWWDNPGDFEQTKHIVTTNMARVRQWIK